MSLAQSEVFQHLREAVKALGPPSPELSPTGAVLQLRGACGYSDTCQSSSLGSYDPSLVALPDGLLRPVPIDELFAPGDKEAGRNFLHALINSALLPSDEAIARLGSCGVHKVRSDPLLRNPKIYGDFVKRLLSVGLVDVSTNCEVKEIVEVFFVRKKNGQLLMVIDCRRSNCYFDQPADVSLCSGDALGRIELEADEELFITSADLKDTFYHLLLPEKLRRYFGFAVCFGQGSGHYLHQWQIDSSSYPVETSAGCCANGVELGFMVVPVAPRKDYCRCRGPSRLQVS